MAKMKYKPGSLAAMAEEKAEPKMSPKAMAKEEKGEYTKKKPIPKGRK